MFHPMPAATWISCIAFTIVLTCATQAGALRPTEGGPPYPPPSCRYVEAGYPGPRGNVLRIGRSMHVTLRREGQAITLLAWQEADAEEPIACTGGTPTVRSLDRIVYSPIAGAHNLRIDESGGAFRPGATKEPGADEIEISVRFPWERRQNPSSVRVIGTSRPDRIRVGELPRKRVGINLDAGRDGIYPDADVIISTPEPIVLRIDGKEGADRLSASGGGEFLSALSSQRLVIHGFGGDDLIVGGIHRDHLNGLDGDDVIYGGEGNDAIVPGEGWDRAYGGTGEDSLDERADGEPDRLRGGSGPDVIYALDGERETIVCGSGLDNARVDLIDVLRRADCEKLHGPDFPR